MKRRTLWSMVPYGLLGAALAMFVVYGSVGCQDDNDGGNENANTPANENDNVTPPANENDNVTPPPDGEALYGSGCSMCHGDNGNDGSAPDITGLSAAELSTGLESATHNAVDLTDEEVDAIAAFLAG
ncbi:MAG: c-type cytochrome [Planctomycetota bacterium]